jgi:hypothetical protein
LRPFVGGLANKRPEYTTAQFGAEYRSVFVPALENVSGFFPSITRWSGALRVYMHSMPGSTQVSGPENRSKSSARHSLLIVQRSLTDGARFAMSVSGA